MDLPLRGPEGVPGLPSAPQDEAGLTGKFERDLRVAFLTKSQVRLISNPHFNTTDVELYSL